MGIKGYVMADSNNICNSLINYLAVLILSLLSSSAFATGGSFGGGGASGSWDEPDLVCKLQFSGRNTGIGKNPSTTCHDFFNKNSVGWQGWQMISNTDCKINTVGGSTLIVTPTCQKPIQCNSGYEYKEGKCVPKTCPLGQTLVNGSCQQKQCPAGQALDVNGQCHFPDDQCPADQKLVNGRCIDKPDDPDEPDPNAELPPFCEWASVMCQWHEEWQQWSNDYAANEQKANLDREELKRLALDSKEYLSELNIKTDTTNQKLEDLKIPLNQIKDQDSQFYDELRLWLENFNPADGTPSEQNPSISFPPFCDWSVGVCNWYLDWKDWRAEYNAHNAAVLEKFNQNLERLNEIKQQDHQYYVDSRGFYEDVREFFGWYKDQSNNENDPTDPSNPENQDGNVDVGSEQIPFDESQRINFVNACPAGEQFNVSFMGQSQNFEFSYQPLCQFMSMIRPFVIAIAYLIGAYILMGLSRGSSE